MISRAILSKRNKERGDESEGEKRNEWDCPEYNGSLYINEDSFVFIYSPLQFSYNWRDITPNELISLLSSVMGPEWMRCTI